MTPPPEPPPKPTTADERTETARDLRPFALAGVTVAFVGLCVYLALPFLPALAWGVALAVIAWPLQAWLLKRLGRPGVAAGLTTAIVTVAVAVPSVFVSYRVAREGANAAEKMREDPAASSVQERAAATPGLSEAVTWLTHFGIDLDREIRKLVEANTRDLSSLAQGSLMALVQAVVALFITFHLLMDRDKLLKQVKILMPFDGTEYERVVLRASDSIHANLRANIATSVIHAVVGGGLFWLLGLPSPVTWGAVMFVLSLLPLFGAWMIWIPAAAYLVLSDRLPQAAILIAWGVTAAVLVDNVIYIRIAGDRMRLHQVPSLLAFLGGLALFGASGMILGPGILAVTVALLDVWRRRAAGPA